MKRRSILAASLMLAVVAGAVQGGKVVLSTPKGTWEITGLTSWQTGYPTKSGKVHFSFKGSPVRAALNKSERVLTAPEVVGDAILQGKKLAPERIEFIGGITGHDSMGAKATDLSADSAVLTGDANRNDLLLNGSVHISYLDKAKGASLVASGTKATISGQAKGGAVGNLSGPVHLVVKGQTKDGGPIDVDGRCAEASFDLRQAPYRIVMQGDVVVLGGQPGYAGETRASKLVVLLDKDYQPIEMQGTGEPGVTTVKQDGKAN